MIKSATDFPAYGKARTSNELRKLGVFGSPSGVRSIWLRHDLANFKARLKALEAKIAEERCILTKAQVQALEKQELDDEACGEVEIRRRRATLRRCGPISARIVAESPMPMTRNGPISRSWSPMPTGQPRH